MVRENGLFSIFRGFSCCALQIQFSKSPAYLHNATHCFSFLQVEMEGLSGNIRFDSRGSRSDFDLEIVELKKEGLVKVGMWNQGSGANFTRNFTESYSEIVESLHNKTLIITTILVRKMDPLRPIATKGKRTTFIVCIFVTFRTSRTPCTEKIPRP